MGLRSTGTFWYTDTFNHFFNVLRYWRCHVSHNKRCYEVQQGNNCTEGFWRNAQEPVVWSVCQHVSAANKEPAFIGEDVDQGRQQTYQHTCYRTGVIDTSTEDTHHQSREDRRCCQTECQCYYLCSEPWRIQTQITSDHNRTCHRNTSSHQLIFLANVRHKGALQQIVRDCRRNCQQQTSSCRQGSSQTTSSNQSDYPVRQLCDFRVSQYHDVTVNLGHFVAFPAKLFSLSSELRVLVIVVLDTAIAILVFVLQQASCFPVLEPFRALCIFQVTINRTDRTSLDCVGQVQASHRADCRCSGVQNRDEQQCPTSRRTCIRYFRYCEEADNYVRQTRSTEHQRQRVHDHIECTAFLSGVLSKTQSNDGFIQFHQQRCAVSSITDQTQLRQRVTSQFQRDEYRRNGIGEDQYTVLCNLSVSYALHAAQYSVEEYNEHTRVQTSRVINVQEARESNTDAFHLTNYISQGSNDQADNRHDTSRFGVVTITDKVRHSELAKLTQVRSQTQSQPM